jgi:tetratricopeptide (TPR) repeat protein
MKFKLIFLSLFFTLTLFAAQRSGEGETFFNNKQYVKAREVYEALLKKKPNDATYNFRYARCSYELKDAESAIQHFEISGTKFPQRDLYLGELYYTTYRFDQSVMAYQTYIATLDSTDKKRPEFIQKLKRAESAARLINKVEDIAIVDSVQVNKAEFLLFYKFSNELGSVKQEPLKINSRRSTDKITYTTQRQDRVYFSDSIKGRMDIFTSFKLLDAWSKPVSVSEAINTHANKNYPFLLLDGVTLYFASDNENSLGGYDLFVTRFTPSTNSYLPPENIGFPFNSPANDYMMVIDEQHKLGWFATDRNQPVGKVVVYTFVPNVSKTILRSEDNDFIRRAAELKTYRKVAVAGVGNEIAQQGKTIGTDKQIQFIVNDSIVYSYVNQFKSVDGAKDWFELQALSDVSKKAQIELAAQRGKYELTETDVDRKKIAETILDLEWRIREMQKQVTLKTIQLRNDELKANIKP